MTEYHVEATIVALERAAEHAVAAKLGEYFVSEIQHLIATAHANRESAK